MDLIAAKVRVLEHARFKYGCRHCQRDAESTTIVTAKMPAQPLPGSNASANVIATVITGKFVDGTPLYRMEDVRARSGIDVGRGFGEALIFDDDMLAEESLSGSPDRRPVSRAGRDQRARAIRYSP
jgi:transposase